MDPLTSSGISGALSDAVAAVTVVEDQLNGNDFSDRVYADLANRFFRKYLMERNEMYAKETRWAREPFWMKRHRALVHSGATF